LNPHLPIANFGIWLSTIVTERFLWDLPSPEAITWVAKEELLILGNGNGSFPKEFGCFPTELAGVDTVGGFPGLLDQVFRSFINFTRGRAGKNSTLTRIGGVFGYTVLREFPGDTLFWEINWGHLLHPGGEPPLDFLFTHHFVRRWRFHPQFFEKGADHHKGRCLLTSRRRHCV